MDKYQVCHRTTLMNNKGKDCLKLKQKYKIRLRKASPRKQLLYGSEPPQLIYGKRF